MGPTWMLTLPCYCHAVITVRRLGEREVVGRSQPPISCFAHQERYVLTVVIPVVGEDVEGGEAQYSFVSPYVLFQPESGIHNVAVIDIGQAKIIVKQTGCGMQVK